eukprot:gene15798-12048_t
MPRKGPNGQGWYQPDLELASAHGGLGTLRVRWETAGGGDESLGDRPLVAVAAADCVR